MAYHFCPTWPCYMCLANAAANMAWSSGPTFAWTYPPFLTYSIDNYPPLEYHEDDSEQLPLWEDQMNSQAPLNEQLRQLIQLANQNGLYDAADYIQGVLDRPLNIRSLVVTPNEVRRDNV